MTAGTKSLTLVLVLVLTVAPAVAVAACSQAMSGMSDYEMVGMVMPPVGPSFSEMPDVSCCVFAPAEIASSWLPQANATAALVDLGSVLPEPSPQEREHILAPAFLSGTPPTQARLCVFLI